MTAAKAFPVVKPFPSSQEKLPKMGGTELSAPGAEFVKPLAHVSKQYECVNSSDRTEKSIMHENSHNELLP